MLSNAYFLAKFRFDTAENEPAKNLQKIAKFANFAPSPPLTLTGDGAQRRGAEALPKQEELRKVRRRRGEANGDCPWLCQLNGTLRLSMVGHLTGLQIRISIRMRKYQNRLNYVKI